MGSAQSIMGTASCSINSIYMRCDGSKDADPCLNHCISVTSPYVLGAELGPFGPSILLCHAMLADFPFPLNLILLEWLGTTF